MLQRQCFPGRILEIGNGIDEFQPLPFRYGLVRRHPVCSLEFVRIRTVSHSPDIRPVGPERLQGTEIGRIRRKDDISGIDKDTCAHVYALLRRRCYLNPLHRHSISG